MACQGVLATRGRKQQLVRREGKQVQEVEVGEEHGQENLLWFLWKVTGDAGEADSGFSVLNNFSGFWGIGTMSSFLVLGSGMSGQVGGGPDWETLIKEVVGI